MPELRMVNTLCSSTLGFLLFDLLSIGIKGTGTFLEVELGSVNFCLGFDGVQEVLGPVHVSTIGGLEVLHDTIGSDPVVELIRDQRETSEEAESNGDAGIDIASHTDSLIGNIDRLLKLLHALRRVQFS